MIFVNVPLAALKLAPRPPVDKKVALLLPFNEDSQLDSPFFDKSHNHCTYIGSITPAISTNPVRDESTCLDVSDGYVTYVGLPAVGTQDFTLEFDVIPHNLDSGWHCVIDTRLAIASDTGLSFHFYGSKIQIWQDGLKFDRASHWINTTTPARVFLIRSGGYIQVYLDRVYLGRYASTHDFTSTKFRIGRNAAGSEAFSGRVDNIKFTIGEALWAPVARVYPPVATLELSGKPPKRLGTTQWLIKAPMDGVPDNELGLPHSAFSPVFYNLPYDFGSGAIADALVGPAAYYSSGITRIAYDLQQKVEQEDFLLQYWHFGRAFASSTVRVWALFTDTSAQAGNVVDGPGNYISGIRWYSSPNWFSVAAGVPNVWQHHRWVRKNGVVSLFVDGKFQGSIVDANARGGWLQIGDPTTTYSGALGLFQDVEFYLGPIPGVDQPFTALVRALRLSANKPSLYPPPSYLKLVEAAGAQHLWLLDEKTGLTVADSLGTIHGSLSSSTPLRGVSGPVGPSLRTITVSTQLLDSAVLPADLQTLGKAGGKFTVGGWVQTDNTQSSKSLWQGYAHLFEIRKESATARKVPISISNRNGNLKIGYSGESPYSFNTDDNGLPLINDKAWHFVCVVRDGAVMTVQVDTVSASFAITDVEDAIGTSIANITIGCRTTDAGSTTDSCSGGYAGWFVANDVALSAADRLALYEVWEMGGEPSEFVQEALLDSPAVGIAFDAAASLGFRIEAGLSHYPYLTYARELVSSFPLDFGGSGTLKALPEYNCSGLGFYVSDIDKDVTQTFCALVRLNSFDGVQTFIKCGGYTNGIALGVHEGKLVFGVTNNNTWVPVEYTPPVTLLGRPLLVHGVISAPDYLKLYVNGDLVASVTGGIPTSFDGEGRLCVGSCYDPRVSPNYNTPIASFAGEETPVDGELAAAFIFPAILSDERIAAHDDKVGAFVIVVPPTAVLTLVAPITEVPNEILVPAAQVTLSAAGPVVGVEIRILVPAAQLGFVAEAPFFSPVVPTTTLALAAFAPQAQLVVPAATLGLSAAAPRLGFAVPAATLGLSATAPELVLPVGVQVPAVVLGLAGAAPELVLPVTVAAPVATLGIVAKKPRFGFRIPRADLGLSVTPPEVKIDVQVMAPAGVLGLVGQYARLGLGLCPPTGVFGLAAIAPRLPWYVPVATVELTPHVPWVVPEVYLYPQTIVVSLAGGPPTVREFVPIRVEVPYRISRLRFYDPTFFSYPPGVDPQWLYDGVGLADHTQLSYIISLVQKINVKDSTIGRLSTLMQLQDTMRVSSRLASLVQGVLADGFQFDETMESLTRRVAVVSELLRVVEGGSATSVIFGDLYDGMEISSRLTQVLLGLLPETVAFEEVAEVELSRVLQALEDLVIAGQTWSQVRFTGNLADTVDIASRLQTLMEAAAVELVEITPGVVAATRRVLAALDKFGTVDRAAAGLLINASAEDAANFAEFVSWFIPALALDSLEFTTSVHPQVIAVVKVMERLAYLDQFAGQIRAFASIFEAISLREAADLVFALHGNEVVEFAEQIINSIRTTVAAAETVAVLDETARRITLVGEAGEAFLLQDSLVAGLRFWLQADESILFVGKLPLGEVDYQAWALNTDNLGATSYSNFAFDDLVTVDSRTLGLTPTGLYELTGDDDDGTPIDAVIRTGVMSFGSLRRKRVPRAYLYVLTDGELLLKVWSEADHYTTENWYKVLTSDQSTAKLVRLGRTIQAVSWAVELTNVDGADFDLRGAELIVLQ